jgi:hypothetical protein
MMKSIRMLVVVLALVLVGALVAGEAGQTQAPAGSEPAAVQSGTAEGTSTAPSGGSVRQVEVQPDPSASYNASIRIPVAGLKPRTSDAEWQVGGQGGCTFAASGNQYTWWSTPLYLPDGSILRYFRMYYNDQNTTYDSAAYLTVYDLYGDLVAEWGIFSSDTGQNYATTEQLDHEIDYDLYNYVINWRPNVLGSSMQVCGFRVYYEYTWGLAFLPDIQKGN